MSDPQFIIPYNLMTPFAKCHFAVTGDKNPLTTRILLKNELRNHFSVSTMNPLITDRKLNTLLNI